MDRPKMTQIRSAAWIAIGGNSLGVERTAHQLFVKAIKSLCLGDLNIRAMSRFFKSPCFPAGAGPDYVNAVLEVHTGLSPEALLQLLHAVEAENGRYRRERWGQRTLDLDLVAYGDRICPDVTAQTRWRELPLDEQSRQAPDQMILPHPRLQDRAFVLIPLREIAPDWQHPITGETVRQMCENLSKADVAALEPL